MWFTSEHLVILGYTALVKTAISVPEDTFQRVSQCAHDLGMSRSEFFSRAAAQYLDTLERDSLTSHIDEVIASLDTADQSAADAVAHGHRTLASADW